jgi:anti-sigma factor RsiW
MDKTPDERLRETIWRRPLTEAEQAELRAWLAAHPEARAGWAAEVSLSAALRRLPDAPVPTNFTARVLEAIERDAAAAERPLCPGWVAGVRRGWLPRVAAAAFAAVLIVVGVQVHQAAYRARLGRSVVAVSTIAIVPSLDSLADFEPIRRLSRAPGADTELLKLLQ